MLGSSIDMAIGLILVFLLFSLMQSAVVEALSAVLRLRARGLENAFVTLIENPDGLRPGLTAVSAWLSGMFGRQLIRLGAARPSKIDTLSYLDVWSHPLVGGLQSRGRPSYVPAANFSSALLYCLRGGADGSLSSGVERGIAALPCGQLRTALTTIVQDADGDWTKVKAGVEQWYDSAMDRLSGEYKRFTQAIGFVVGLAIAAGFNVDAIHITQRLAADPALRADMIQRATAAVTTAQSAGSGAGSPDTVEAAEKTLLSLPPVGWIARPASPAAFSIQVAGWVVTALAGLLGAPFWFDTLQKVVNIRGTGPKPTPDDRGAVA